MSHEKVVKGLVIKGTLGDGTGDNILTISSTGVVKKIAAISGALSNALTNGNIFVGNGSNVATGVTPSGDITLTNTGVFGIATGVIVNADINVSAAIALSKLAALTANRATATNASGVIIATSVTDTELGYVSGVTSAIQTQLNTKQATITGAATTVVSSNLTANRAVVSGATGKIEVHPTTTLTEIGYVTGVTSAIQTQLNTKIVAKDTSSTLQTPGAGQDGFALTWDNGNSRFTLTAPPVAGVPNGGTTAQVLRKASNVDQDTEWHSLVFANLTDVSGTTVTEINLLNGMTVGSTELNTLTGIGANVQSQLDNKLSSALATDNIWVGVGGVATPGTNLPSGTTIGSAVIYRVGGTDVAVSDGGTGIGSYTAGDILTASGATTLVKLPIGTALQVLRVNAGGTALEYATPAGGISGLTTNRIPYATSGTTIGDDSALTWDATNNILTVNGASLSTPGSGFNLFLGNAVGNNTLTQNGNIGVGNGIGQVLTSGVGNIGVGATVLSAVTSGSSNIAIGASALATVSTSSANVAIGSSALTLATGQTNTAIGGNAGDNITSGSNNLIVGYNIDAQSATASNQLSIQNIIFGVSNSGSGTTPSTGQIGIGEPAPTRKLEVAGSLAVKAGTSTGQIARTGGVINSNITQTGNITTGEDTLYTYTIPASVLATDKDSLSAIFAGTCANTAATKRIRVKFGATTIFDATDLGSNVVSWKIYVDIIRTGATTQKIITHGTSDTGAFTNEVLYSTAAETLSGTVNLVVTGEATNTNDIVFEMGKVTWQPAE